MKADNTTLLSGTDGRGAVRIESLNRHLADPTGWAGSTGELPREGRQAQAWPAQRFLNKMLDPGLRLAASCRARGVKLVKGG